MKVSAKAPKWLRRRLGLSASEPTPTDLVSILKGHKEHGGSDDASPADSVELIAAMSLAVMGINPDWIPRVIVSFDAEETNRIAEGAEAVGVIGMAVPEPVTLIIGTASKVLAVWARSAVRRDKCIGVAVVWLPSAVPIPFEYSPIPK